MDSMLTANIALDVLCLILLLIPAMYLLNKRRFLQKPNCYFLGICAANALMIIGDLADWIFPAAPQQYMKIILQVLTSLYYVGSAFILYFFGRYMEEYLQIVNRISKIFLSVLTVLCGVQVFLAVISPFTGAFFYVSDSGYQRGSLFLISQLIPLFCYLMFTIFLVLFRQKLTKRELAFFLLYIFIPLAAEMLQMAFRGIAIVNVGVTIALMFIFVNIQLERDLLMEQKERELEELRVNIMLSQIQPHFLYNTLTTIRQLCDIDPKLAKESIRDFSCFLRANMSSLTNKFPIPFEQELLHAEHYLKLEQQRFVGRLTVKFDTPVTDFSLPSLTLQPLAENAVRHGIMKKENSGKLTIRTYRTAAAYFVTVTDDGIGFVPDMVLADERAHIGIQNVRERLETMCGGLLTIESVPGKGTTATIMIPCEEQ